MYVADRSIDEIDREIELWINKVHLCVIVEHSQRYSMKKKLKTKDAINTISVYGMCISNTLQY